MRTCAEHEPPVPSDQMFGRSVPPEPICGLHRRLAASRESQGHCNRARERHPCLISAVVQDSAQDFTVGLDCRLPCLPPNPPSARTAHTGAARKPAVSIDRNAAATPKPTHLSHFPPASSTTEPLLRPLVAAGRPEASMAPV